MKMLTSGQVVVFRAAFFLCLRGAIAAAKVYPGAFCTSRDSIRRHYLDSKLAKETEPHIHTTTPLLLIHLFPFLHLRCHTLSYVVTYILDLRFELRLRVIVLMHHLEIGQRAEPKWNRNGSSGQELQLERKGRFSYTILINSVLGLNYLLPNVVVDICFPMFSIFWCRTVEVKPPTQQSYWLTSGCAAEETRDFDDV